MLLSTRLASVIAAPTLPRFWPKGKAVGPQWSAILEKPSFMSFIR
jgi:hypothetical protein